MDHYIMKTIVSKHHRTTAAQVTAEFNIHLQDPVSTKTVWWELHKYNIQSTAATAKPLITGRNAKRRKRWCDDHKTWTFAKIGNMKYGQMISGFCRKVDKNCALLGYYVSRFLTTTRCIVTQKKSEGHSSYGQMSRHPCWEQHEGWHQAQESLQS